MYGKEFGTAVSNTCSLEPLRISGLGSSSDTSRILLGIPYRVYQLELTSFSRKFVPKIIRYGMLRNACYVIVCCVMVQNLWFLRDAYYVWVCYGILRNGLLTYF